MNGEKKGIPRPRVCAAELAERRGRWAGAQAAPRGPPQGRALASGQLCWVLPKPRIQPLDSNSMATSLGLPPYQDLEAPRPPGSFPALSPPHPPAAPQASVRSCHSPAAPLVAVQSGERRTRGRPCSLQRHEEHVPGRAELSRATWRRARGHRVGEESLLSRWHRGKLAPRKIRELARPCPCGRLLLGSYG